MTLAQSVVNLDLVLLSGLSQDRPSMEQQHLLLGQKQAVFAQWEPPEWWEQLGEALGAGS